jgi:hypothetical protein
LFSADDKVRFLQWDGLETADERGETIVRPARDSEPQAYLKDGVAFMRFPIRHIPADGEISSSAMLKEHIEQHASEIRQSVIEQALAHGAAQQQKHGTPVFTPEEIQALTQNLSLIVEDRQSSQTTDGTAACVYFGVPKAGAQGAACTVPETSLAGSPLDKLDASVLGAILEDAVLKTCPPQLYARIAKADAVARDLRKRFAAAPQEAQQALEDMLQHSELFTNGWVHQKGAKDKVHFQNRQGGFTDKEGEISLGVILEFPEGVKTIQVADAVATELGAKFAPPPPAAETVSAATPMPHISTIVTTERVANNGQHQGVA